MALEPLLLAVICTVAGSVLNTVRGYVNSEGESYSARKLLGAIIVSAFAGIAIAQTIAVDGMNEVGIAIIGLTSGFAIDYAVSKAKKETLG